ncbi:MAG: peptidylprolyl isomerase [Solirubrobacteraceae bacterium]
MPVRDLSSLARLGQAHAAGVAILVLALALAACGASRGHAGKATTSSARRSVENASTHTTVGAEKPHCEEVEDPTPKGPQHLRKPKGALNPAKSYFVELETNCGDIDIKLAVSSAPAIAASFAYLVKLGFYDQLTFHLVLPGDLIQGGDPEGNGSGGPGYQVVEPPPAGTRYTPGTVAMAKTATQPPGAAGSQFFIVVGSKVQLPPQYALLGEVVKGWSTVQAISHVPTEGDTDGENSSPASPVVITHASLTTSG